MIDKDPYYEIKYKKIGENHYNVGYSSYKLENVLAWRDECFEIMTSPKTNADRIRSMTDEELAGLLKEVKEDYQWANPDYPDCEDCGEWLNWLQLEAE